MTLRNEVRRIIGRTWPHLAPHIEEDIAPLLDSADAELAALRREIRAWRDYRDDLAAGDHPLARPESLLREARNIRGQNEVAGYPSEGAGAGDARPGNDDTGKPAPAGGLR